MANPALNENTFGGYLAASDENRMTIQGAVNKTFLMLVFLLVPAAGTWNYFYRTLDIASLYPWMIGAAVLALVIGIATVFKKDWAPLTAPIYAGLEGIFIGGLSAFFETMFPGIVIQATALTFTVLFSMLALYKVGAIRATAKFRACVIAATGAIALLYVVHILMSLFGAGIPFIHESGLIGIGFSLFVVGIASLNLILDFDLIESGAEAGAAKHMEWYAAFSLMVTLIWLYLEILRLLAKLRSFDD